MKRASVPSSAGNGRIITLLALASRARCSERDTRVHPNYAFFSSLRFLSFPLPKRFEMLKPVTVLRREGVSALKYPQHAMLPRWRCWILGFKTWGQVSDGGLKHEAYNTVCPPTVATVCVVPA